MVPRVDHSRSEHYEPACLASAWPSGPPRATSFDRRGSLPMHRRASVVHANLADPGTACPLAVVVDLAPLGKQYPRCTKSPDASPGVRQIGPSTPSACPLMRSVVVSSTRSGSVPRQNHARYACLAIRSSAPALVVTNKI